MAWQLADELRSRIVAVTARPPASRDERFSAHIPESAASASANLAEGFCRYSHREFARFVSIARASLAETQARLTDGFDRRYLTGEEHRELASLANRGMIAVTRLHTYLRTHPDPDFTTPRSAPSEPRS